jgi:hypothetical protein
MAATRLPSNMNPIASQAGTLGASTTSQFELP